MQIVNQIPGLCLLIFAVAMNIVLLRDLMPPLIVLDNRLRLHEIQFGHNWQGFKLFWHLRGLQLMYMFLGSVANLIIIGAYLRMVDPDDSLMVYLLWILTPFYFTWIAGPWLWPWLSRMINKPLVEE